LDLVTELAPLHPRNNTFPGEVFLGLAADALDWCGASRADPLALEGLRERFLPESRFRGRQHKKFQYAVLAAAALHGGTQPDLLDEIVWWQTDDFWQYALFAGVAYIRGAASRAASPCTRHVRIWPRTRATLPHNNHFGTSLKWSYDDGAADHNGGYLRTHPDQVRSLNVIGCLAQRAALSPSLCG
jgi:hypothetical protein